MLTIQSAIETLSNLLMAQKPEEAYRLSVEWEAAFPQEPFFPYFRAEILLQIGHIEQAMHRIDHLLRLRALQDETGGFQTFIPLAFHPDNTKLSHITKPSGLMDLRVMAISRLMLDNFPHIKAYWVMLGLKTAQVALSFGADDIDGTVVHEKIYHEAGAETPQEVTVDEIRRLITEAGRNPVERDTLYRQVNRGDGRWTSGERIATPSLAVLNLR